MANINYGVTLIGKKFETYVAEASNKISKAIDSALDKTLYPLYNAFGDFCLTTYKADPNVSQYMKDNMERSMIHDNSAILGITYGDNTHKNVDWRGVGTTVMVVSAVAGGALLAKELGFFDQIDHAIDEYWHSISVEQATADSVQISGSSVATAPADEIYAQAKRAGKAGGFFTNLTNMIFRNTSDNEINATDSPTPAPAVAANGSAEEYHFSPGIDIHGSPQYTKKVQDELVKLEKIDPVEFAEVMLYLEAIYQNPLKDGETYGKGGYPISEDVLDSLGYYALIHEKEHELQNIEPRKSSFEGKSGWYDELDAVTEEVKVYAKHHNLTEDEKQQYLKYRMLSYKGAYPKEYAQFISEN